MSGVRVDGVPWTLFVSLAISLLAANAPQAAEVDQNAQVAQAEPEARPVPANPLKRLIQGIFGGWGRDRPAGRATPDNARADDDRPRDHIDARAAQDPQQSSLLRRAQTAVDDGNIKQALEILQFLIDQPQDSLTRAPDGSWTSVRSEANRLLGKLPAEALDQYRLQYGRLAEQLLETAHREGDRLRLVAVAERFFYTPAGYQAANQIATAHLDREEFGMAAYWFERLLDSPAPFIKDRTWRLKAEFALRQAGRTEALGRLTADADESVAVKLGVTSHTISAWRKVFDELAFQASAALDEWPLLYGTPSRTGVASGGEPLLLPRWSAPSTASHPIRKQIQMLTEDVADQGTVLIPAFQALAVDGKIIWRTLRGVQVVEADTGRPLWETAEGVSAERILHGDMPRQRDGRRIWQIRRNRFRHGNDDGSERHRLISLLFRNGTHGILSSDGRQIFVIEDNAILSERQPGYDWGFEPTRNDPYRRDWSSNKLVAYDLESGRPLWEVGGTRMQEAFDLPLSGVYFLGVPVPSGEELFIVGERDSEIRLHVLDRRTGTPLWSQRLAFSDQPIDKDLARRWLTAQVSVGDGVIVCPTTVGWLVAVDRSGRKLLWAQRYSSPRPQRSRQRGQATLVPYTALNERWCPSAPIIAGNHVIYTPPEEDVVVCCDLLEGTRRWRRPKSDWLYLAGVHDQRALFVGRGNVIALNLENGTNVWSTSLSAANSHPSGRGIIVDGRFYLPLQSGALWAFDLDDGEIVAKSYLSADSRPLGNLLMYRGMLLSLGPLGLTSFEQREAVVAQIRERKQNNPRDAWGLLREADIQLLNRDHAAALDLLRQIDRDNLDASLRPHYRDAVVTSLAAVIRSDHRTHQDELDELAAFVESDDEKWLYQQVEAEQFVAVEDYEAAFDVYWELAGEPTGRMVLRSDDTDVHVRLDRWAAGKLADLWPKLTDAVQSRMTERITALAGTMPDRSRTDREWFANVFAFHPAGIQMIEKLAEADAADRRLMEAENRLLQLTRSDDPAVAASALERLARLLNDAGLKDDASAVYKRLERQYPDQPVAGRDSARELVAELQETGAVGAPPFHRSPTWGDAPLTVQRGNTDYSAQYPRPFEMPATVAPFFRNHRFLYDQNNQRLAVLASDDDALYWTLPLRGRRRSNTSEIAVGTAGHALIVNHRGVIHGISPVERRIVWTQTLGARGDNSDSTRNSNRWTAAMQRADGFAGTRSAVWGEWRDGTATIINADYVCHVGRREMTVFDTATGKLRWTRSGINDRSLVDGTEDVIYVRPHNGDAPLAFRASDGKRLAFDNLEHLLNHSIAQVGSDLVTLESRGSRGLFGFGKKWVVIQRLDPVTKTARWKQEYPDSTHVSLLEPTILAAVKSTGEFELLDLESGQIRAMESLAEEEIRRSSEIYVVADYDAVYLILNQGRVTVYSESLPSVRVHGKVLAFNRISGKRLWEQEVANQNLLLEDFQHSPVVIFSARTYRRNGNYWSSNVLAIDKRSGRKLADESTVANSDFRGLTINNADRFIELRTYNERVRLTALEPAAAGKP